MAINKVVYDGRTLIDITDSTVAPEHLAEGYVAYNASGEKITGELSGGSTIIRDEQDSHGGTIRHIITDAVIEGTKQITSNGTHDVAEYASAEVDVEANLQSKTVNSSTAQQTVTADSGYDGLSAVTVNAIATATQATPSISVNSSGLITATATQTAGYVSAGTKSATEQLTTQSAKTVTPTETSQTAVASGRYTTGAVTVGAISSTYVGSGIDRNDSTDLTASGATVTVPSGYYASSASKSVASGSATTPATTITANPSISVNSSGLITATASATKSITPTVSAGYVSSGTAGTVTVSGSNTSQLTTKSATTYTPTTTAQTIASGTYLTGVQTIAGDANLLAENIAEGISIFGITGTHSGGGDAEYFKAALTSTLAEGVASKVYVEYNDVNHYQDQDIFYFTAGDELYCRSFVNYRYTHKIVIDGVTVASGEDYGASYTYTLPNHPINISTYVADYTYYVEITTPTLTITENGSYDVGGYGRVVVNV